MTAIVTDKARFHHLRCIRERITAADDYYYLTVGRSEAWANELVPPTPDVSFEDELAARHAIQSYQRFTDSDIAYVSPRYNWTSGNTYVPYDDADPILAGKQYYVYVENTRNVYICLDAPSGASTNQPTGTATTPFQTADGYVWKFLYNIDASNESKFVTTDYIPVIRNATVAAAAVEGAIHRIVITANGSGYTSPPTVTVTGYQFDGTAVDQAVAATATVAGGLVTRITIDDPTAAVGGFGQGFAYAVVSFSGGGGSGAAARAVIAPYAFGNTIESIAVTAAGSGYTNGTYTMLVDDDGDGVTDIEAVISGGGLSAVDLGGSHTGYNYTQLKASIPPNAGAGTSAAFVVNFNDPVGGFGYDPRIELKAYYLMFSVDLVGSQSGAFVVGNDYRQISIIRNPLNTDDNREPYTGSKDLALDYITTADASNLSIDEIITGVTSTTKAYVTLIDTDSTPDRIYYHQDRDNMGFGRFNNTEVLTGSIYGATAATTTTGFNAGPIDRYSGDMLYLENRPPVSRSDVQTEKVRLVIQY